MIHYLRYNGRTIADVEATKDDIHCVICIKEYSEFLLNQKTGKRAVIYDFDALSEIRGEYHEGQKLETPDGLATRRMKEIGLKYHLDYVRD